VSANSDLAGTVQFAARAEEPEPEQGQVAPRGHQSRQLGLQRVPELVGEVARRMKALLTRFAEPVQRRFDLAGCAGNDRVGCVRVAGRQRPEQR